MNINSIKFEKIEKMYKNNKKEVFGNKKQQQINKDVLEISDLGKYLNKVNFREEKMRLDKINDIKKRIENGTYKVDSNDLAKKIVEKMKGGI